VTNAFALPPQARHSCIPRRSKFGIDDVVAVGSQCLAFWLLRSLLARYVILLARYVILLSAFWSIVITF